MCLGGVLACPSLAPFAVPDTLNRRSAGGSLWTRLRATHVTRCCPVATGASNPCSVSVPSPPWPKHSPKPSHLSGRAHLVSSAQVMRGSGDCWPRRAGRCSPPWGDISSGRTVAVILPGESSPLDPSTISYVAAGRNSQPKSDLSPPLFDRRPTWAVPRMKGPR